MFKSLVEWFTTWKENFSHAFSKDKVLPIEIFLRHCNYSAASAHKTRFAEFSKECCFDNLLSTIAEEKGINVTIFLDTSHPMEEEHFIRKQQRYPIIEFKAGSEAASFLFMLEYVY